MATLRPPSSPYIPSGPVAPVAPAQPLSPQRFYRTRSYRESFLSNYNDPYEINSLADVILNSEAKRRQDYWGIENIPVLNTIPALGDLLYNKTLKPVFKGKWGEAGLNLLVNLGETLDIVANPVKGLILEGWEGVGKGIGLGDQGRVNYDFDTGHWSTDLIAEIFVDPLNLFQFGGKLFAKNTAKAAIAPIMKEAAQEVIEKGGKVLAEEAGEEVYTQLAKRAAKIFVSDADETWGTAVEKAAQAMSKTKLKPSVQFTQEFINKVADLTLDKMTLRTLSGLQKLVTRTDAFEKLLLKSTWASSYGMFWYTGKRAFDWVSQFIQKQTLKKLQPFMTPFGTFDISKIDEVVAKLDEIKSTSVKEFKDEGLNDSMVSLFLEESIKRDLSQVEAIIKKYAKDPKTAARVIRMYFSRGHKLEMPDYIRKLKDISRAHGGLFDDYVNRFQDIYDDCLEIMDTARQKIVSDLITAQQSYMDTIQDALAPVSKSGDEAFAPPGMIQKYITDMQDYVYQVNSQTRLNILKAVQKRSDELRTILNSFFAKSMLFDNAVNPTYTTVMIRLNKLVLDTIDTVERKVKAYIKNFSTKPSTFAASLDVIAQNFKEELNTIFKSYKRVADSMKEHGTGTLRSMLFFKSIDDVVDKGLEQSSKWYNEHMNDFINTSSQISGIKFDRKTWTKVKGDLGAVLFKNYDPQHTGDIHTALINFYQTYNGEPSKSILNISELGFVQLFEDFFSTPTHKLTALLYNAYKLKDTLHTLSRESLEARRVLEPFLNILDTIPMAEIKPFMLTVTANEVYYKLKISQLYANLQFFISHGSDPASAGSLNAFITDLLDMQSAFGATLHNMMQHPDTKAIATEVYNHAVNYRNYKEFVDSVMRLSDKFSSEEVKLSFLDTVQTYARDNLTEIDQNFAEYVYRILKKTEEQINFTHMIRKLDQETLLKTRPESADLYEEFKAGRFQLHTARDDVFLNREIHRRLLKDTLVEDPNVVYLYWDIESNGLNPYIDPLLELSWGKNLDPIEEHIARSNIPPSERVLNKLFPDAEDKMAAYYNRFGNAKETEAEILLKFLQDILQLQAQNKKVILVGHHIKGFDIQFIKTRLELLAQNNATLKALIEAPEYQRLWSRLKIEDTLEMLRKKEGYFAFSVHQRNVFTRILRRYVSRQLEELPDAATRKFIQPVTGQTAFDFIDMARAIEQTSPTFSQELRYMGGYIYQILRDISNENKLYATQHIKKTFLDNHPSGDYYNISSWLNDKIEGVRKYAAKRSVDFDLLMEYFTFKEGDEIEMGLAQFLSGTARAFDRMYKGLKNLKPLEEYGEVIKQALQALKDKYPDVRLFRYLRTDKLSPAQNWVMLQYAYNRVANSKLDLSFLHDIPNFNRIKHFLSNPGATNVLYKSTLEVTDAQIIGLEKYADLDFDLVYTDPMKYYSELQELYKRRIKGLQELSIFLDEQDAYRVSVQKINAALEAPVKLLQEIQKMMKDLPADLQEAVTTDVGKPRVLRQKIVQHLQDYSTRLMEQQLLQVLTLTPEDLYKHLYHNALGVIQFDLKGFPNQELINKAMLQMLNNRDAFMKQGIAIVERDTQIYLVLTKADRIPEKLILPELDLNKAAEGFRHFDLLDRLVETRQALRDLSEGAVNGTFGDITDKKFYETIYANLPEDVRKLIPEEYQRKVLTTDAFFHELVTDAEGHKKIVYNMRFNHTNLGTARSRRMLFEYASSDVVNTYIRSMQIVAQHAKTKLQYMQLYFHKSLSITNSPLFNKFSDSELLQIIKQAPEYRLAALVVDPKSKQGYKLISIAPRNVKSIQLARRLNAVIVPTQTYSKLVEVINENKFSHSFMRKWQQLIYAYKAGYLMTPGTIIRNIVDGLIKNFSSNDSPKEMLGRYLDAFKIYYKYRECLRGIRDLDPNQLLTRENILKYFESPDAKLTKEMFNLVHDFMMDGPSAGIVDEIISFQKKALAQKGLITPDEKKLWNSFVDLTNLLMKPNREIEQIHRLAQYFMLLEQGKTHTEAFWKIAQTHFDYALKSDTERMLELVIPFYTFTMRNLEYWVDLITKQGWAAILFRDIMTPVWNFDDYDYNEYSRNMSLQYQILSGALPLSASGLTLKLSPSFMDTFNMLTNPIEVFNSRIAAPIKAPLDIAQDPFNTVNLLPVVGAFAQRMRSGARNYGRTDNLLNLILPSVFGATQRWKEYRKTQRYYPRKSYSKRPQKYYPRTKRFYPKKQYAKKTYHKKTYHKKLWYSKSFDQNKAFFDKGFRVPRFRVNNFYMDLYTRTGKARWKLRLLPVYPQTLQYRIKDMAHYFK